MLRESDPLDDVIHLMMNHVMHNIYKNNGFLKDHNSFIIIQGIIRISESPYHKAPNFNTSPVKSFLIITL